MHILGSQGMNVIGSIWGYRYPLNTKSKARCGILVVFGTDALAKRAQRVHHKKSITEEKGHRQ